MQSSIRPSVLEDLQDRIHRIEGIPCRVAQTRGVSTGFAALDALFAPGGLKRGTLIEWLGEGEGSGAATLALRVAAHILRGEGICIVVDHTSEFYPLAAASLGIPLERTVLVQPQTRTAALWTWEQSLRCPGVTVTFGWLDALNDRLLRRLQLGVETGGGLGFLLRPPDSRAGPSWATTRIGVKPLPSFADTFTRRLQVRLTHRSRNPGCHCGGRSNR